MSIKKAVLGRKNKKAAAGTVGSYAVAFCCIVSELVLYWHCGPSGILYGLRLPASASCLGRHSHLAGRGPNSSSLYSPFCHLR